ncbi:MAG TPA: DHA2 family efflux MFS transporter permease subunit [Gemmatimonadaceae bacterium]|nr:DHA2 family efflux MFS transporter permease subunit [Gemmatimonadaceae bacterium]
MTGKSAQRWTLIGSILGSGAVFAEGSVTGVALPSIAKDLHLGMSGLQWTMNGYLLTLSALILLGGALGDRFSRRKVFTYGLIGFAVTSLGCALAPNLPLLVAARVLQGIAGGLLVPNSLALLETTFHGEERGVAIGQWSSWSAISTSVGPLLGGSIVDATSWRFVFVLAIPIAVAGAIAITMSGRSMEGDTSSSADVDYVGAALMTLGLAAVVAALIVGPDRGFTSPLPAALSVAGVVLLIAFVVVEHRVKNPLLPPNTFASREFAGVNATTFMVYAALNGLFFLLMLELQNSLHYSALAAGASLLPINALMLVISPIAGRMSARIGPRIPMVAGSLVAAIGMVLFARVRPGAGFLNSVLPAAVVFGTGLSLLVAPLTTVALTSLGEKRAGLASGVNNAVARVAGLIATAVVPFAAGLGGSQSLSGSTLVGGFTRAMFICAGMCAVGSVIAAFTMPGKAEGRN